MSDAATKPGEPLAPSATLTTSAFPGIGGETAGDGSFPQGTQVTVVATPYPDYEFTYWAYINGLEASTDASYTFTLNTSTELIAHFRYDKTVFDLVKLTRRDAEGVQQRPVWVNPSQVIYVEVRADGITQAYLRDGKEFFVIEQPSDGQAGTVFKKPGGDT